LTVISPEIREAVSRRAGRRCEYCQLSQGLQVATFPVDHILSLALEGRTDLSNLALACIGCNAAKWIHATGVDYESGDTVPLFNPRMDFLSEHFHWSEPDPTIVTPLTPIARATVALLDLNSPRRLAIRRWLLAVGEHPPK
jgi:hypothetical protein